MAVLVPLEEEVVVVVAAAEHGPEAWSLFHFLFFETCRLVESAVEQACSVLD